MLIGKIIHTINDKVNVGMHMANNVTPIFKDKFDHEKQNLINTSEVTIVVTSNMTLNM